MTALSGTSAPPVDPVVTADHYWRMVCALAATHLLGTTWPPPGRPQRTRVVGHWGCNPGIAWITGHLAASWREADPLLLVVGTGHASSFVFAHDAVRRRLDATAVSSASARYGQPGGDPSELIGLPAVPYSGGELGPALAVSQGLAAGAAAPLVACVIGDGECETPAALAAFAHADVLLGDRQGSPWLPVVNANGARMGGPARFTAESLARLLRGLGYEVYQSGAAAQEASTAARAALEACARGRRAVWLSVTEKGWPAPALIDGIRYRGHLAHKAPPAVAQGGARPIELVDWFAPLDVDGLLAADGVPAEHVVDLARRVTLTVADRHATGTGTDPDSTDRGGLALVGSGKGQPPRPAAAGMPPLWQAPITAVDAALVARRTLVVCPDEAGSNGLHACADAGTVVEVLAEETCAAWAWGSVEASRATVFATYEAFAPLAGSVLAQYAKMTHARPTRPIPPLLVLATSLGWANSPTHQNTDLTGTLLARPLPEVTVVYPVGAHSAADRIGALADRRRDGVALVVCSKQRLLDLPDPGGPVVGYRIAGSGPATAVLITVGDVCATEAVAAGAIAAAAGLSVHVLAVVEVSAASGVLNRVAPKLVDLPVVGVTSAAADYLAAVLWRPLGRLFPVHGYAERWGPTAWETLCANRLDRLSLLNALRAQGAPIAASLLETSRRQLDERIREAPNLAGVVPFDCPPLDVLPSVETR